MLGLLNFIFLFIGIIDAYLSDDLSALSMVICDFIVYGVISKLYKRLFYLINRNYQGL